MNLSSPFNLIISLSGHECTIERADNSFVATVKMAKANRDRNMNFIEDSTHEGHELVVSKDDLDKESYPVPRRGDFISSVILGDLAVTEVVEQIALGSVIGYRLRCD